ncbi:uncharacterized protein F4822DRAFT_22079 [Hypoxylon trugodes]|uniref:uncharacterized protein n=1 Tax=Hypoxylon trugodes TaxID=326681 RepID=UPI0021A177EA|nr:uncharacterized protein F4822DRAFT_22079 [Hypoxylon trugodes]KAI1393715.1 hypothetical protein F4822DRAFT_22079 [Hypoxylon trugodes]
MDSNFEAVAASSNPPIISGNSNGATTDPSASSLSPPTTATTSTSTTTNTNTITATITATTPNPTITTTKSTITNPTSTSTPSNTTHSNNLHAHRQSHNSSKLPAFRFADLKKEPIALPSLLQSHHIPPSPVSPVSDHYTGTQPNTSQELSPQPAHQYRNNSNNTSPVSPEQLSADFSSPSRSRASTFQTPAAQSTATSTSSSANAKRSASLDSSTATTHKVLPNTTTIKSPTDSTDTIVTIRPQHRRAPLSGNSINETSSSRRMHRSNDSRDTLPGEESSGSSSRRESGSGQRELLLPKTLQRTATADEKRGSVARRPPVSYKPPVSSGNSGGTASIPPIRSFRSSGERRSLVLDMNIRSMRGYDGNDDYGDSNHRDRTLRALEGRRFDDASQITPPDSAGDRPDGDDNGDLFLKIAREDPLRRGADSNGNYGETQSAISRVTRSSRRPLSMGVSSYQPASPPQMFRRLSDQESSRPRGFSDDQSGEKIARSLTYRGFSRDKQSDETKPKGTSTPLRGSPLTPRFQEPPSEPGSAYNRRRQPSVDNGTPIPSRMSSIKQSSINYSHPRTYNSSPLVPKSMESQKHDTQIDDANHGVEGTNSTASTAAPSTVWDELDDLKSRIHRLELTGKLPPTSGAAISRASDERPPTAHTNATTLSASPKRGSGSAVQAPDANNIQRDGHPLLHSALTKSKNFLSAEVFEALETAANDALALSIMMGTAGQPGPIASGASSIGSGTTITDRQLRRKADSICRSLTELCLALSEGAAQAKPQQVSAPAPENPPIASPTITKFPGVASSRRPSTTDHNLAVHTSPRALSRYEDKRTNALVSSALPTPRYNATAPTTPTDGAASAAGRKTSLLISRSRRAGTEEPEEGRKSSLLRTRRATTEEPEERIERKPLLVRSRRGTIDNNNDEEDVRFRAPSRAITEVHGLRSGNREYSSQLPAPQSKDAEALGSSALPRRRLASQALNTRLVLPAPTTGITTPQRRYFDRSTPDREVYNPGERTIAEDRPQRQFSVARAGSMDKRANRGSMIATSSPAAGGYR